MAITRLVYTNSGITVFDTAGGADKVIKTAQNATFTVNVPRENVNALGFTGTVDRPQLDAAEGTVEWTMVPQQDSESHDWDAATVQLHIANTTTSAPTGGTVTAKGVGSVENALLGSLSCEATVGALATMTCSYTGIPLTAIPPSATAEAGSTFSIALTESQNIDTASLSSTGSGGFHMDCAQSLAFAWDMPIQNVVCLGNDPTVSANVTPFSNPPGTASITVEGLQEGMPYTEVAQNYTATIGEFGFTMENGRVDSQTNSVAVGEVFSTFNYVINATADGCSMA